VRRAHALPEARARPYGVGTALLRDVVCRLIWVIPLVGIIDCLTPLGEERRTLRDRMVHTRVMQERLYRARRWRLTDAAVRSVALRLAFVVLGDLAETSSDSSVASGSLSPG
jgi:hypothetical protein